MYTPCIWCLFLEKEILMWNTLFQVPAVHTKKMVISEEKMFFATHTEEEEEVSVTGTRQIWIWGSIGRASDGFLSLFLSNLCSCSYLCLLVSLCHLFILQLSVLIRISIFFVNCNITYSTAYQELKCTFFFKVPEVQKKTVTEEKIHVAVSKKIEPPPKGISDLFQV